MKAFRSILLALMAVVFIQPALAEKPNDADALKGVKEGKVLFDINMAEPKKMTLYLAVIQETVDDLKRQDVKPNVVLAFRGLSVKLIKNDREDMELTDFEHLDTIATQLAKLQKDGVRMESCSVATRLFGVKNDDLLEGIKPVGNTFVSLTGYQAQGFANIPIY